jgi:hypothetical protein
VLALLALGAALAIGGWTWLQALMAEHEVAPPDPGVSVSNGLPTVPGHVAARQAFLALCPESRDDLVCAWGRQVVGDVDARRCARARGRLRNLSRAWRAQRFGPGRAGLDGEEAQRERAVLAHLGVALNGDPVCVEQALEAGGRAPHPAAALPGVE